MIKIFVFETRVLFLIYARLPANQFPCKAL
jgi:hypothetical protein